MPALVTRPQLKKPPTPNIPLLREVLAYIDAHPERWNQRYWVDDCGTTYCVGGWTEVITYGRLPVAGEPRAGALLGLTQQEETDLVYNTLCPGEFGVFATPGVSPDEDDHRAYREAVQVVAERIAFRAGVEL